MYLYFSPIYVNELNDINLLFIYFYFFFFCIQYLNVFKLKFWNIFKIIQKNQRYHWFHININKVQQSKIYKFQLSFKNMEYFSKIFTTGLNWHMPFCKVELGWYTTQS